MELMEAFLEPIKKYRDKKHIEIELRLGKVNGNMFDTNVGKDAFTKVMKGLNAFKDWEQIKFTEDEVFYWSNHVRCIYEGDLTTYQKKSPVVKQNIKLNKAFDVRLGISQEIPCQEQTTDATHTVSRKRWSFLRKNVRIDMTIVMGDPIDKDVEDDTKYQIELELIDVSSDQLIFSAMHKVLNVLHLLNVSKC